MPTIVHFEIPTDDIGRAKEFYTKLFGWKIEKYSEAMDYWMITTTDEKGNTAVGGGMMKRQKPEQGIINYIDVPSVDESAVKIQNLGDKIVVPKMAVPGEGCFAVCLDTENNCFGIWETGKKAK